MENVTGTGWALPAVSARDAMGLGHRDGRPSQVQFRAVSWLAWLDASHARGFLLSNLNNAVAREAVDFFTARGVDLRVGTEPTKEFVSQCVDALDAAGVEPDIVSDFRGYYSLAESTSTGVRAIKELREMPSYIAIADAAKEDGAAMMATLLTHVGWNSPDGTLSIHRGTSGVGREAFAAVGFGEEGPTGATIPEVLTRAARLSTELGFAPLARQIVGFVAETWPEQFERLAGGLHHDIDGSPSDDVVAESSPVDSAEVEAFVARSAEGDFSVPDQHVTAKTRGSAQREFAERVKRNYGWQCALTGIATREFLVASHIVPWSEDESIRRDPANGICLSTLVDRAFDTGYLAIHEDYTVHADWDRIGTDEALRAALERYDGQKLSLPAASPPSPSFLRRRLTGS